MNMHDRKQMIRHGFNAAAGGYDHPALNFFPRTAERLLACVEIQPAARILDVCTGTGAVALAAARRVPEGTVIGIDISEGMLDQARSKAESLQLGNVSFLQMDLDHLDFAPGQFDLVTCSFGLFFVADMAKAVRDLAGTVRRGGQLAVSCFTGNAFSPYAELFISLMERFGHEVPPPSWQRLASEPLIRDVFAAAAIDDIDFHHAPMGYRLASVEQWWDVVWNAGFRSLLNQLGEDECAAFKAQHLEEARQHYLAGERELNIDVIVAVGKIA